jgi:hypothetical protein
LLIAITYSESPRTATPAGCVSLSTTIRLERRVPSSVTS